MLQEKRPLPLECIVDRDTDEKKTEKAREKKWCPISSQGEFHYSAGAGACPGGDSAPVEISGGITEMPRQVPTA
jgi:hypothetical protein